MSPSRSRSRQTFSMTRSKPTILLTGVVMVVLGIAVLINPIGAVETLITIMGWILVVYGAITLAVAVLKGNPLQNALSEVILGGLMVVVGLIMVIFSRQLISIVWTIIGIIVLLTGVFDVVEAGDFRRVGSPLAVPATISGVITACLGIVVVVAPLFSATLAMLFAAVALIVNGITEIIFGLGA